MIGPVAVACAPDVAVELIEGEAVVGTTGWRVLVGGASGGALAAVVGAGSTGVGGVAQLATTPVVASAA